MSNDLYLRPEVHIEVEDGRSFVRRSAGQVPGDSGDAGGHVGRHRGGRVRALGEQPLHHATPSAITSRI